MNIIEVNWEDTISSKILRVYIKGEDFYGLVNCFALIKNSDLKFYEYKANKLY